MPVKNPIAAFAAAPIPAPGAAPAPPTGAVTAPPINAPFAAPAAAPNPAPAAPYPKTSPENILAKLRVPNKAKLSIPSSIVALTVAYKKSGI